MLVADLGFVVVDGIVQVQMTQRFGAVPGIVVADAIVLVLGVSGADRLREVMRLARAGARPPLEVLFPVSNRRAGGGPRRGSWRRVRRGPRQCN